MSLNPGRDNESDFETHLNTDISSTGRCAQKKMDEPVADGDVSEVRV